jgi:hypothetical protein
MPTRANIGACAKHKMSRFTVKISSIQTQAWLNLFYSANWIFLSSWACAFRWSSLFWPWSKTTLRMHVACCIKQTCQNPLHTTRPLDQWLMARNHCSSSHNAATRDHKVSAVIRNSRLCSKPVFVLASHPKKHAFLILVRHSRKTVEPEARWQ